LESRIDLFDSTSDRVMSQMNQVQSQVLQKVAEMLTDNIYDLIPGYSQLQDTINHVLPDQL
jgi:hypothetical protein